MAINFRELEEGLSRLESIDAARIVNQGSQITEVHVIAAPDKPAKQVARDVQSMAMARYGLAIDRRVISVVQIRPHDLELSTASRAALTRIGETPNGTRTTIEVTLRYDSEDRKGMATGPAVSSARQRLVGEATLDAIEKTFPDLPPMALDAIARTTVGIHDAVVTTVVTTDGRGGETLSVGSALITTSSDDATVKAVLNALNRRLGAPNE